MSNGFIKKFRTEKSKQLKRKHTSAFLILDTIAENAKREFGVGHPLLEIGEAIITAEECGLSPQQFQTGLKYLETENYIELMHRGRKDKNSKLEPRIKPESTHTKLPITSRINGTVAKLIDSSIYDINPEEAPNHIPNQTRINSYQNPHKEEVKKKEIKKNIFLSDSIEIGLSEFFLSLILKRKPDFKKPDLNKWAKSIDEMIRLDKRDSQEIRRVMEWINQDSFEFANVLSIEKLRKRFDQLQEKSKKVSSIKENRIEENKQLALRILNQYLIHKSLKIEMFDNHIEFIVAGSQKIICINYDSNGFEDQLMNAIEKTGCKKFIKNKEGAI